ncbi:hypothetical protein RAS12_30920 (plasmid) [Achromobacter seleniivolatilans]|uniref:Phasin domain-containing protein n=1 Tax=Achromobacter seleniivolatilans TaxID=3047478 RepID=A0ABY9ME51_9BURK|nr:hypothetical protein [Achromobacter sp. R39]WMD24047.1 hypothetical protein RAS12_30920 [Achromobacter sp. R39]
MGEIKQEPFPRRSRRTAMSSSMRDRKFVFLASYRLALAQAQVSLPASEHGWMAFRRAPNIPTWDEYFQLMRSTAGVSPSASQQMEGFLASCVASYANTAGVRQNATFRQTYASIAAEARRILTPLHSTPQATHAHAI